MFNWTQYKLLVLIPLQSDSTLIQKNRSQVREEMLLCQKFSGDSSDMVDKVLSLFFLDTRLDKELLENKNMD